MKIKTRLISSLTAVCLTVGILPTALPVPFVKTASAAIVKQDKQRYIGSDASGSGNGGRGSSVGNATYPCQNLALEFCTYTTGKATTPGFRRTGDQAEDNRNCYPEGESPENGDYARLLTDNRSMDFEISIADNPLLKQVAEGGNAKMRFSGGAVGDDAWNWTAYGYVTIWLNGQQISRARGYGYGDGRENFDTGWFSVDADDVLTFTIDGDENKDDKVVQGVIDFLILFKDDTRPVLENYTFETNGIENQKGSKTELLIPQFIPSSDKPDALTDEKGYIDVSLNVSKPVKTAYTDYPLIKYSEQYEQMRAFANHVMFTNPTNTGYSRMGEQALLKLDGITTANGTQKTATTWAEQQSLLNQYASVFNYRYTAERGDFSSNKAIPNGGDWGDANISDTQPAGDNNVNTFMDKINLADLYDAAGNYLAVSGTSTADTNGNREVNGNSVNPFAFYDVIVDAEPPTYSKTMNGIYPDILTKLVLGKNDELITQVNFSESVQVKKYFADRTPTEWKASETYVHFNNDIKSYYVSGDGTKTWKFKTVFEDKPEIETPLLKVVALANDSHTTTDPWAFADTEAHNLGDTYVITDYVGNPLRERVNIPDTATATESDEAPSIQSSINWAQLSLDNTPPEIAFDFPTTGASDKRWAKMGGLSFNATDAQLPIPQLDPTYNATSNFQKPSMGIFRPSNPSEDDGNQKAGLVYYIWSQEETVPEVLTADNYALVKKYSLTGTQPEGFQGDDKKKESLLVANNFSTSIIPPPEAYLPENSGVWYLHAFTSDMTWDTARQRIQYQKVLDLNTTEEGQDMYYGWAMDYETQQGHNHKKPFCDDAFAHAASLVNAVNYSDYDDLAKAYEDNLAHVCSELPTNDTKYCQEAIDYVIMLKSSTQQFINDMTAFEDTHADCPSEYPYCAEAINYANAEGMKYAGNYDLWTDDDWKSYDSNWMNKTTEIWIDNQAPDIQIGSVSGNNSSNVSVNVTTTDELSGIKTLQFQYVAKGAATSNAAWITFPNFVAKTTDDKDGDTKIDVAETFGNVIADGDYDLYIKAVDRSGNESIKKMDDSVHVDLTTVIVRKFTVDTNTAEGGKALQKVATDFMVGGLKTAISAISYAVTDTPATPADNKYTAIDVSTAVAGEDIEGISTTKFTIPEIKDLNGTYYLHIKVADSDATPKINTFVTAYKLDNTAPEVVFNPDGVPYPKESQSVSITVNDANNGKLEKYMLVKKGDTAPTVDTAEGWTAYTSGDILIDGAVLLEEGKDQEYTLYAYAKDEAGNVTLKATKPILIFRKAADPGIPDSIVANLLSVHGDAQNGIYGTIKVDLGIDMKEGYEYSTSVVRGDEVLTTFARWMPYTNFVDVKLPILTLTDRANLKILVKFKSPGGTISTDDQIKVIDASGVIPSNVLYATVSRDILKALPMGAKVTLTINAPVGVTVKPADSNPYPITNIGKNMYTVTNNACYSFVISDAADAKKTDMLYTVVDNFDTVAPVGMCTYSITQSTSSDVLATLETSEPVLITNNSGRSSYSFKENGTFTFEFVDAAGNTGTATATVNWIDKNPPLVEILRTFDYTSGTTSKTFNTIKDNDGNVVLAQGMVLNTVKKAGSKDFKLVTGTNPFITGKNGKYDFLVTDAQGNTAVASDILTEVVGEMPMPEISISFVDDDGKAITPVVIDGKAYANGNAKVTLSGTVGGADKGNKAHDGAMVLSGTRQKPVVDNDGNITYQEVPVDNSIPMDAQGKYSVSKVYSDNGEVTIALCDTLGNVVRVPLTIDTVDKEGPTIVFNAPIVSVAKNKPNFDWKTDLSGYIVTDNVTKPEDVKVELLTSVDLTKTGRQTISYSVKDLCGNETIATQVVYIMPGDGMLVLGNNSLFSASSVDVPLLSSNTVNFSISRYDIMKINGTDQVNKAATYDVYYVKGLYREGQMKYIATGLTMEELVDKNFNVTFDSAGWYTIIVRNQEREREFTSFFISSVSSK